MIKVIITSTGRSLEFVLGPEGQIVVVPTASGYPPDLEVSGPAALLKALLRKGWDWRVDWSSATAEETPRWFMADLAARADRTLGRGLPIRFKGKEYRAPKKENVLKVLKEFEDDIVASGRMITIESDDEQGLVVGAE